jgi:hypothetical protein
VIVLKHCGETYHADEKHVGYSIQCRICGSRIPITHNPLDSALASRDPPSVEYIPSEQNSARVPAPPVKPRRLIRNWLLPAFGLLTLLLGVSLILVSYRNRTNTTLIAQTAPSPTAPVPVGTSYTYVPVSTPTPRLKPSPTPTPADANDPLGIDKFLAKNDNRSATPTPDSALDDLYEPTPTPGRPRKTGSPDDTNVGPVFRARPTGTSENPRITVTNDSSRTLTLTFAGERIVIVPHAVQTITKPPGTYSYTASAQGVVPASGSHAFEIGYVYEWTFYISTTYR